jgi:protein TonB
MDFSLHPATPSSRPTTRTSSRGMNTMDLSLNSKGAFDAAPRGQGGGLDWRNLFRAWVDQHKYYPTQAILNDDEGEATVQLMIQPDGRVTSVQLVGRSGSQWLDMALVALFRDQTVPPLRGETEPFDLTFTMHYILIRR